MNDVDFPYVVLRNWDGLPEVVDVGGHSDLDLLVYDFDHFLEIFPMLERQLPAPRVRFRIPLGDDSVYCDVRSVGDNYYPRRFQENILNHRVPWAVNEEWKGFFVPDPVHHRIALAYHAVHHKGSISPTYRRWLGDASITELFDTLKKSNIGWVPPDDHTVGKFNAYWKGATSAVEVTPETVKKTQTGYLEYDLIENERNILSYINDNFDHFPKLMGFDKGIAGKSIMIENCGEQLTVDNLPADWRVQLIEIIDDLARINIEHRDIRPDNLMVKDGKIKLIDFGWSIFKGVFEEENFVNIKEKPPACLGFPFKSTEGFSDKFSMRQIIKKIEYELEEKGK
jgi:hypothetical protein